MRIIRLTVLLVFALCGLANAQSVTVDFGNTTASVTPDLFGIAGLDQAQPQLTNTLNLGIALARSDYAMNDIVPQTSLSTYQACVGTNNGVCNPATWNWGRTNAMQTNRNAGVRVMGIMDYNTTWNSNNGQISGAVIDYNVFEDIVQKLVQHFTPDLLEVDNEPNGCQFSCLNPTDYATYYFHVAHAVRVRAGINVAIGGPTTSQSGAVDYIDAMGANTNILPSWVNFISWHGYSNDYAGFIANGSMVNEAQKFWPGVRGYISEWNASLNNGNCAGANLTADDSSSVGWVGAVLVTALGRGMNSLYFDGNTNITQGCSWLDNSGNLLKKDNAWLVLKQLGLNTGTGAVKSTTFSGLSAAAAAVNSSGNPVVALANWSGAQNVTVTMNNLGLANGTYNLKTYLADYGSNNGSSPIENVNVNVLNGSMSHTIAMTANSVAGLILAAAIVTTPTPTPAATPTPTSGNGIYLIGSAYVIDGGFYSAFWGWPPAAESGINNQPNLSQQYQVAPSGIGYTICNLHNLTQTGQPTCLTDGGANGFIDQGQGTDVWTILPSGANWTLQDQRTSKFMGAIPQANQQNIPMSSTAVALPLTYVSGLPIATPTPTPTPVCSPTITSPVVGSTISGSTTFTVSPTNCTTTNEFFRLYLCAGSNVAACNSPSVDFPSGATSFAVNTAQVPDGPISASVILWDSPTGAIKQGTSPEINLTVSNATPTPIPTPSPTPTPVATPTPCSATCTGNVPTGSCTTNCACNGASPSPTPTPVPSPSPSPAPTPTPVAGVMRANDFLNTLGVTSHIVQQGLTPAQWEIAWDYLGVRHDRDDFTCDGCDPNNWNANFFIPEHQKRGVTFVGMPDAVDGISITFSQWDQLGKAGALFAVEGPNEPNNQPFVYNGVACNQGSTFQGCANFQKDLLAATRADANTSALPMFSITEVGAEPDNVGLQFLPNFADYANLHNYVKGNDNTLVDNRAWASEAPDAAECCAFDGMDGEFIRSTWSKHFAAGTLGTGASIPRVTTETGWDSTAGLSADMIGKVLSSVYLDAAARGWSYTFIYQMMDDKDSFGLFNNANPPTPKLVATYIHNLTTILADTSSNFTPVAVTTTISPQPATVHSLLLQKSNGQYELAITAEAYVSQVVTAATVSLGATYGTVKVYDITSGTAPVQSLSNVSSVSLNLSDHPMIVEFK